MAISITQYVKVNGLNFPGLIGDTLNDSVTAHKVKSIATWEGNVMVPSVLQDQGNARTGMTTFDFTYDNSGAVRNFILSQCTSDGKSPKVVNLETSGYKGPATMEILPEYKVAQQVSITFLHLK